MQQVNAQSPGDHWVSIRHVQLAVVLLQAAGLNGDELLASGGLTHAQLADGHARVPLAVFESLFDGYEAVRDDPFMGLHMADAIQPSTLGSLGFLLQSCGTVADLLDIYVRFRGLLSTVGASEVVHAPGRFELRWDCIAGSERFRRQACEYVIGSFSVVSRLLVPAMSAHICVQFAHPAPAQPEHVRKYFDFFGCPVYFDRPHTSIIASSSLLKMRLPHGDAVLKELLERHASHMLERQAAPACLTKDVRRLIKALLLDGSPTKEAVATQLGISARSLHRRLEAAGTSYSAQLDAVRLSIAHEALARDDVAIADLAEQLNFSSPQAFMRWFKTLSGMTPGHYRSASLDARAEDDALRDAFC